MQRGNACYWLQIAHQKFRENDSTNFVSSWPSKSFTKRKNSYDSSFRVNWHDRMNRLEGNKVSSLLASNSSKLQLSDTRKKSKKWLKGSETTAGERYRTKCSSVRWISSVSIVEIMTKNWLCIQWFDLPKNGYKNRSKILTSIKISKELTTTMWEFSICVLPSTRFILAPWDAHLVPC